VLPGQSVMSFAVGWAALKINLGDAITLRCREGLSIGRLCCRERAPVANDDHHPSQTSRSPSITVESATFAEYQEWPFQGFLKRTKIGDKTIYDLEFQLPHVPEQLHLPILSKALGMRSDKETSAEVAALHEAGVHSKMHPAAVRRPIKRVRWTPEEDATILKMREEDGCSWEEIHAALPSRTLGTIQVHYSMKLKK
jgi:hypothetical protein